MSPATPARHRVEHVSRPAAGACVVAGRSVACLPGCAGWTKLTINKKNAAEERKNYGPTADQRIETIAADAKKAKAGSHARAGRVHAEPRQRVLEEHDPAGAVRDRWRRPASSTRRPPSAICKGALEDPDERVQDGGLRGLAEAGGPEAVELLGDRYRADREIDVRLRALRELGDWRDKSAIPVLAEGARRSRPGRPVPRRRRAQAGQRPGSRRRRQHMAGMGGRSGGFVRRMVDRRGFRQALLNAAERGPVPTAGPFVSAPALLRTAAPTTFAGGCQSATIASWRQPAATLWRCFPMQRSAPCCGRYPRHGSNAPASVRSP